MIKFAPLFVLAFLFALMALPLSAQNSQQQNDPEQCVPAETPATVYTFTAQSGSIGVPAGSPASKRSKLGSKTVPNNTNVVIRLVDINPYLTKCSVSTTSQAYTETAIASFLGQLGGLANISSASTPDPSKVSAGPPQKTGFMLGVIHPDNNWKVTTRGKQLTIVSNACVDSYMTGAHHEIALLQAERDGINMAITQFQASQQSAIDAFNKDVGSLAIATACSHIVAAAKSIAFPAPPSPGPTASASPTPIPLDQRIDTVAFQSQRLLTHLTDGTDACKQELAEVIDTDTAFLEALVHGSSSVSSAVDRWRDQFKTLNTVASNIQKARQSVGTVLANRQNFLIETPIHESQKTVTVTMSCSPVTLPTITADLGSSTQTPKTAANNSASDGSATQPKSGANSPTFEVKFGEGPRFVYAGGVVVSPLEQDSFTTTATPGGTGATANTIIFQQDSNTRILPIAMLHARYWDLLPHFKYKHWEWVPNYFSAGITAKSTDNNGTSIEYLFGPAWAFADRQLFITAGAYAGRQQRLQDSLAVGSTTSLASSNLPTTQNLIWKAGFALTWAPAGK